MAEAGSAGGLARWAVERFGVPLLAVLVPGYVVAMAVGRAAVAGPDGGYPGASRWVAVLAPCAFFLTLRVIDDCRDLAGDRVTHPDRLLSRGAVSVRQLVVVAVGAVAVQALLCAWLDHGFGAVTEWWIAAAASVCVAVAAGAALVGRPLLPALCGLPVAGMVCGWCGQIGAGDRRLPATDAVLLVLFGTALSAAFDLSRKLAPQDGGRSYAGVLGPRVAAAVAVAAVAAVAVAVAVIVRYALRPSPRRAATAGRVVRGGVVAQLITVAVLRTTGAFR